MSFIELHYTSGYPFLINVFDIVSVSRGSDSDTVVTIRQQKGMNMAAHVRESYQEVCKKIAEA